MAFVAFPEPPELNVDFIHRTGDSKPLSFNQYSVENPHPGFGKDPNILNEYGHTKYPMWVNGKIANNEEEEKVLREPVASVPASPAPVAAADAAPAQAWGSVAAAAPASASGWPS